MNQEQRPEFASNAGKRRVEPNYRVLKTLGREDEFKASGQLEQLAGSFHRARALLLALQDEARSRSSPAAGERPRAQHPSPLRNCAAAHPSARRRPQAIKP
jgi:hypothetical protein